MMLTTRGGGELPNISTILSKGKLNLRSKKGIVGSKANALKLFMACSSVQFVWCSRK